MMMAAWVTGLVSILKTNFMTTEMENRTTEAQSGALETKSAKRVEDTDDGVEGSRREERESAGIIGLGTIFRTHGKALMTCR